MAKRYIRRTSVHQQILINQTFKMIRCYYAVLRESKDGKQATRHLYLEQRPPVVLLELLAPLLHRAPLLLVPPQQLDVVHRRLQNASLVLPHISHLCTSVERTFHPNNVAISFPHQFIIWFILCRKKSPELFDPIIDVEPASTLNWGKFVFRIICFTLKPRLWNLPAVGVEQLGHPLLAYKFHNLVCELLFLLMLWLSFFTRSFVNTFKSSSPSGSSWIVNQTKN